MKRLKEKYFSEVVPAIRKGLGIKNQLAMPKIDRVVVSVGVGSIHKEREKIEAIRKGLSVVTGQWPATSKARKSIAGFKVREGATAGLTVTLRGARMYDFLDRLINVVLPRVRDFRGISVSSFDQEGNITIGLKEHSVFPEVTLTGKKEQPFGLQITVVTTAKDIKEGKLLATELGLPLAQDKELS